MHALQSDQRARTMGSGETGSRKGPSTHFAEQVHDRALSRLSASQGAVCDGRGRLHGARWREQQATVLDTLARVEQIARSRNDQERILWLRTFRGVTKIYVSLPELARHIGRELGKTFKGDVRYSRSPEEPYLRVRWYSDARGSPTPRGRLNKSKALRNRGLRRMIR